MSTPPPKKILGGVAITDAYFRRYVGQIPGLEIGETRMPGRPARFFLQADPVDPRVGLNEDSTAISMNIRLNATVLIQCANYMAEFFPRKEEKDYEAITKKLVGRPKPPLCLQEHASSFTDLHH